MFYRSANVVYWFLYQQEYEETRQQYIAQKEEKQTAEKKLKALRAEHAPLRKKIDEVKAKKEAKFAEIKSKVNI